MLFSIIVPVYKVENYLNQCVDSILSQTFQDFEIILVDDGSPDSCPTLCDEYAKKDSRIKVVHKENGGLADARNAGLEIAVGEYIFFLDADDYWDDNASLMKIYQIIEEKHPDVVTWRFKKYLEDKNQIQHIGSPVSQNKLTDFAELLRTRNFTISACFKAVKREFFDKYGLKFLKGVYSEDIEWSARVLSVVETIYPSNLDFYVYRQREGSITHEIGKQNIHDVKSHVLSLESLSLERENAKGEKFKRLLAEEFCNFVITLASYKDFAEEICWVKEKKYFLKWASSKKSKILRLLITCIGVKLTLKLIKAIR